MGFNYKQEELLREDLANTQGMPPAIGSIAPDFYMINEDGDKIRFQNLDSRETLLVIRNIDCPWSVQFLEALSELGLEKSAADACQYCGLT